MKTQITINDFEFGHDGCGTYWATYISPKTGCIWTTTVKKQRIDDVKNNPTPELLKRLANYCRRNGVVNSYFLGFEY
ncbi:MAG: hypothetical protein QXW80_06500 [Candidatus Micrarchaeia archaeon]